VRLLNVNLFRYEEDLVTVRTLPSHDRAAEERHEIAKHAELYQVADPDSLRMIPQDWEKLSNAEPLGAYMASMSSLGDIRGLHVLDAGCGDGWMSVILAKLGASVSGFDISPEAIDVARTRAAVNGVADRISLQAASFYSMPFPDNEFDIVIGQAILHHLRDKHAAAAEIRRVLKPGGRALFVECFGNSAVLERLRLLVPVASGSPEDPDHWRDKVSNRDIDVFRAVFSVKIEHYHVFSRLDRIFRSAKIVRMLNRVDVALLRTFPIIRRYARTIFMELT
jgi:SAM-dependent methyltransferase